MEIIGIKEFTVSQLNRELKIMLESNEVFKNFYITGEVSERKYHESGHLYFYLKDNKSVIKCVVFYYKNKKIPENIKEGEIIRAFGSINVYEKGGNYQVLVEHIERKDKKGDLLLQLEQLKEKLMKKGYFDEKNKMKLPFIPKGIGVVTAETGAAIRDIIKTAKRRFENINIYIYPSKVQGDGAAEEIIRGIKFFNTFEKVDVIIIGRGGGSIEDLWCFNDENLAEEVFKSEKPIVSAVGHEIDFVITDFIADKRASTPTQAAEIVVPEKKVIIDKLSLLEGRLKNNINKILEKKRKEVDNLNKSYAIRNITSLLITGNRKLLIDLEEKINRIIKNKIERINRNKELTKNLKEKLNNLITNKIERIKYNLDSKNDKLISLNPLNILKRGYSVTKFENDKIISSIEDIKKGDIVKTILWNGEIYSKVEKVEKNVRGDK